MDTFTITPQIFKSTWSFQIATEAVPTEVANTTAEAMPEQAK